MRKNRILSGIEQSQSKASARAHYASGLVAPPLAKVLARGQEMRKADIDTDDQLEATGGVRGLAEQIAAQAREKGYGGAKGPLKIVFIKDSAGEIVGARIG